MNISQKFINSFLMVLSIVFLIILWMANYNKLSDLFDYSVLISGIGQIKAGLLPYRDFSTPVQSAIFYIGFILESLFGENYLSLGLGNLFLTLFLFFTTFYLSRYVLNYYISLLCALALCTNTTLQHGIIWYNPLAFVLLATECLYVSYLIWKQNIKYKDVVILSFFVLLLGMTKINFHALGIGLIISMLIVTALMRKLTANAVIYTIICVVISGILLPPIVESLINGIKISTWWTNVVVTPSGRIQWLYRMLTGNFWFLTVDPFPRNYSTKIVLEAFVFYGSVLFTAFCYLNKDTSKKDWLHRSGAISFILIIFFLSTSTLVATNGGTQMISAAFFLVGLICVIIAFSSTLYDKQKLFLKFSIFLLAMIMLITGSVSAARHSRLNYGYGGLEPGYPLVPSKNIHPALSSYFINVSFSSVYANELEILFNLLEKQNVWKSPNSIYWGPGLEFMNRIVSNSFRRNLPLWYDDIYKTESESEKIISILETYKYRWFATTTMRIEASFPDKIREYFEQNYYVLKKEAPEKKGGIIIYIRK